MGTNSIFTVQINEQIFPGFYNTVFDYDEMDNFRNETWEEFQDRIVHNIIYHYEEVLPAQFKIIDYELVSPKEYNYRNDKLYLIIECSYEDILFFFFDFKSEYLMDYVNFEEFDNHCYHEALLETFLQFIPFTEKYEDLSENDLYEKFLYD